MTFGQRFKELRLEKGLTQQELADDFNKIYGYTFSKPSISQYENGKRTPENLALKNFAEYFNVTIDYLFGVSDIRNTSIIPIEEVTSKESIMTKVSTYFNDINLTRKEKDDIFKAISFMYFDSLD